MSIRKIIYNSICTKLNASNQYKFEWLDLWKAQVGTKKEQKYPFNFLAGFISINRINWADMVGDVKEGTTTIEVYLFFDKYEDTFDGADDQATSLEILDTVDQVAEDLHWLETDPFKELTQISEEDLTTAYDRPAYRLTFETIIYKQVNA